MCKSKKILILGSGLVTGPIVDYLFKNGFSITVASNIIEDAEKLINNNPKGKAVYFHTDEKEKLQNLIRENDLIVSLLPASFHVIVAKICIEEKKNMVTTSYVSEEMNALKQKAKDADIIILNEVGLDPGIDHMSAMKIIDEIKEKGGNITGFNSCCGGLPAPEHNDNPLGYKFSWSPRGVILAARNSARYLKNGKEINVASKDLFTDCNEIKIDEIGKLEIYPNRDSLPYIRKYSLEGVKDMFRGTLRNTGHCFTWLSLAKLGYFSLEKEYNTENMSFRSFFCKLIDCEENSLFEKIESITGIKEDSETMNKFKWLGLLDNSLIPFKKITPLDLIADSMLKKMSYNEREKDMVVLIHRFDVEFKDHKARYTSTLIDYGNPDGFTSMARTVSIPAAISIKLILENKIKLKGVRIPVHKEIYEPILEELTRDHCIKFKDTIEKI